jgi:hypothetical protein
MSLLSVSANLIVERELTMGIERVWLGSRSASGHAGLIADCRWQDIREPLSAFLI